MKDELEPLREKFTVGYLTELGIPHLAGVAIESITDSTGDAAVEMKLVLKEGESLGFETIKMIAPIVDQVRDEAIRMTPDERFVYTRYVSESPAILAS